MAEQTPAVLLGAGASANAGVPMAFQMTERLADRISGDSTTSRTGQAFNFVRGALAFDQATRGESPNQQLDVEKVFAAVELLADRHELEVSPFVANWHPSVDQL